MDIIDFKDIINTYANQEHRDGLRVVVVTQDPSMGGSACEEISHLGLGFDWEEGRLNLYTANPIVKKSNPKELELRDKDSAFHKEMIAVLEKNNGERNSKLIVEVFRILKKHYK